MNPDIDGAREGLGPQWYVRTKIIENTRVINSQQKVNYYARME